MKKILKKPTKKHIYVILAALILLFAARVAIFFNQCFATAAYQEASINDNRESMRQNVMNLAEGIEEQMNKHEANLNEQASDIAFLLKTENEKVIVRQAAEICNTDFLFVADRDGVITSSVNGRLIGRTLEEVLAENEAVEDAADYYNVVTARCSDGRTVCLGEPISVIDGEVAGLYDYSQALGDAAPDGRRFTFAAYQSEDGAKMLYCEHLGVDYSGKTFKELGIPESALTESTKVEIGGWPYILTPDFLPSVSMGNIYILTATQVYNLIGTTPRIAAWSVLVVGLLMFALVAYGFCLDGCCTSKKDYLRKVGLMSLLFAAILFCVSFYTQTLESISDAVSLADYNVEVLQKREKANDAMDQEQISVYRNQNKITSVLLAKCIDANADKLQYGDRMVYRADAGNGLRSDVLDAEGNPIVSYANCPILKEFTSSNDGLNIYVINRDGYTIATNGGNWYYTLQDETLFPEAASFIDVLDRKSDFCYSQKDGYTVNAIPCECGMVVFERTSTAEILNTQTRSELVRDAASSAINAKLNIYPYDAEAEPFSENVYEIRHGSHLFIHNRLSESGTEVISTEFNTDDLYATRNKVSPFAALVSAVAFALVSLFMTKLSTPNPEYVAPQEDAGGNYDYRGWEDMSPGQKLVNIITFEAMIAVLILGGDIIYHYFNPSRTSATSYIMTGDWSRGLNFFSISACGLALFQGFSIQLTIRFILRLVSSGMPEYQRAKFGFIGTIISILCFTGATLFCLYFLGLNVKGLFASAGIMAAVVGFASKEYISAIFNGIINMSTDKFRVGEWVDADGFYGRIRELSLTRVVVENKGGDIKYLSAADMGRLVNKSRKNSKFTVSVPIDADNDYNLVDQIIRENLDMLNDSLPQLTAPLIYLGVGGLSEDFTRSVVFQCTCDEKDRSRVSASFSTVVSNLLTDNGVTFPHEKYDNYNYNRD